MSLGIRQNYLPGQSTFLRNKQNTKNSQNPNFKGSLNFESGLMGFMDALTDTVKTEGLITNPSCRPVKTGEMNPEAYVRQLCNKITARLGIFPQLTRNGDVDAVLRITPRRGQTPPQVEADFKKEGCSTVTVHTNIDCEDHLFPRLNLGNPKMWKKVNRFSDV